MGWNELLQILCGTLGTLGFAFVFHIRGKRIFFAAFGGLLAWALYLLLGLFLPDATLRCFLVSVVVSLYAELLARLLKTPAVTFSTISLIPLVPGSSLYYTMTGAFRGDGDAFLTSGVETLKIAAALSLGTVLVSTSFAYAKKYLLTKKQG